MEKFFRICSKCGKEVEHKTKSARDNAIYKKSLCRKCGCNTPERLQKQHELNCGKNNPFYGRKHSEETLKKLKGRKHSEEFINRMKKGIAANYGSKNGMYGRSVYSVWLEKYGKEEADKRNKEMKLKQSETQKINYDPSKHKSPPFGCGNGWGGWYNGWYFRSIYELTYMINTIEACNLEWSKGENSKFKIFFDDNGKTRRYFPDFVIENRMIEIKPAKLMNTRLNILKREAAEKYCSENNMVYEQIDNGKLEFSVLSDLVEQKKVVFDKKTENKFEKFKDKINNKTERTSISNVTN